MDAQLQPKGGWLMKSPFPGMDPYIEECGLWEDFHNQLVIIIAEALADAVPERYAVSTGERAYVVLATSEGKDDHRFLPDIGVVTPAAQASPGSEERTAVAEPAVETAPISMRAFLDEHFRETFIEIRELDPEHRLVTCVEVLSPSNKRRGTEGWEVYLRKRQDLLLYKANLVEMDLLRGGQRMPMLDAWPSSPYTLLVARQERTPSCKVWPAHFRLPLPPVPIPLDKPDPDITLNLQPLIEGIYARYRYYNRIDYSLPLTPPLPSEDAAWLERQVRVQKNKAGCQPNPSPSP